MKSNRVANEQARLIEILKRNPGKFSRQDLIGQVHICIVTIKNTIDDNGLNYLLKQRKTGSKKKDQKGGSKYFRYNRLDDIY